MTPLTTAWELSTFLLATGDSAMTDQVLFDNFNDALIATHRHSRKDVAA
jgi:hypothetical protein